MYASDDNFIDIYHRSMSLFIQLKTLSIKRKAFYLLMSRQIYLSVTFVVILFYVKVAGMTLQQSTSLLQQWQHFTKQETRKASISSFCRVVSHLSDLGKV
jgi:hypothetical protein